MNGPDDSWNDAQLVEGYLDGDGKCWDVLCQRYGGRLLGFLINKIGNREDAADLVQETLIEAMGSIATIHHPERFGGWLFTIAQRVMAKWLEANKKRGRYDSLDAVSEDGVAERGPAYAVLAPVHQQPDARAIAKEQLYIVRSMAKRLPRSERAVFLLKLANPDMQQKEIAKTLRIKVAAVKVRWHRARNRLKTWLETEYPGEFTHLFR